MSRRAPYGKRIEDCLEAIYILQKEKKIVRVRDLAAMLHVKPSTVVGYLDRLVKAGYIEYEKRELIKLTREGEEAASKIYEDHLKLREFLRKVLMLPEDIAEEDACYIEHGIHKETISRIGLFLDFINRHIERQGFMNFLERLRYFYECGELPEECKRRLRLR
ncbi:MAG: metal-dependent transcriptional regulator [Thermoprotei archaeon]|nr:metal-dependent transcriptional regulator [Thermoprotei archaeon]